MSSHKYYPIQNGPGKFDLMQALFASKPSRRIPIKVTLTTKDEKTVEVTVESVARINNDQDEQWKIIGWSISYDDDGREMGKVHMTYSTRLRAGRFTVDRLLSK